MSKQGKFTEINIIQIIVNEKARAFIISMCIINSELLIIFPIFVSRIVIY